MAEVKDRKINLSTRSADQLLSGPPPGGVAKSLHGTSRVTCRPGSEAASHMPGRRSRGNKRIAADSYSARHEGC